MAKFSLGKSLHGALSRSTHGGGGGTSSGADFYAQRHLVEEVTTLRRRVKELEEKEETLSSGNGSNKTVDTDEDREMLEVMQLRKELNRVENEKAAMELDFMNQLSQMARDAGAPPLEEQKSMESDKRDDDGESGAVVSRDQEIRQLKEDLASADQELKAVRTEADSLQNNVSKLEAQKAALIEENAAIRREVDSESKVITSLNDIMAENDKHYTSRIEKLEAELRKRDSVLKQKQEELNELSDTVVKHEGQKTMLLEEITDLRMQLDRMDDDKKEIQKKLEEYNQVEQGDETESVCIGSLKQAASDAEEKADELKEEAQKLKEELRSFEKSYKSDVSRLEETVSTRNLEAQEATEKLQVKETELEKLMNEHEQLQKETKELKEKLDESRKVSSQLEQEVSTLQSQRVFYEKRTSHCIMEQMTEADEAKEKVVKLEKQVKKLEHELNEKLSAQANGKKTLPPTFPPPPPLTFQNSFTNRSRPSSLRGGFSSTPSSPSHSRPSTSLPPSPSTRGSVKALAERFESKSSCHNNEADAAEAAHAKETAELRSRILDLENQLEDARNKNETLQQRLKQQNEQASELHAEVAALNASKSALQAVSRKTFEKETEDYATRIGELEAQVADYTQRLEAESTQVEHLKHEIHEMTSERLAYEECTMQAYEKRASTTHKTFQSEINQLKNELTKAHMKISKLERDHANQVKDLEEAIQELNLECDKELELKQGELDMVKFKLEEQVDIVSKLQREREQLCVQMNGASSKRRDDLEEVQAELMEKSSENTSLQRALQSLQMQVEHHNDSSRELQQLRKRVKELEAQKGPTGTALHKHQFELEKLEEQNQLLKDQVRNVTFERRSLQERLNTMVAGQNEERTTNVLRERNEKLRREVERLNRKLQRKEGSINRIAI